MTSNSTLRKITSNHAKKLSLVLKTIAAEETMFTRFDLHYVPNPLQQVMDEWVAEGNELFELIEPVDSLHPTQLAQSLIAKALWEYIERKMPFVLGPVNANNDKIDELFRDQGGH